MALLAKLFGNKRLWHVIVKESGRVVEYPATTEAAARYRATSSQYYDVRPETDEEAAKRLGKPS